MASRRDSGADIEDYRDTSTLTRSPPKADRRKPMRVLPSTDAANLSPSEKGSGSHQQTSLTGLPDARSEQRIKAKPVTDGGRETREDKVGIPPDDAAALLDQSEKKSGAAKSKKKRGKQNAPIISGSRGVDTLLRNAYRAQLDMLALAATKANIMISLNGLLMSMLIISGTHLVSINGLYVIPISVFLVTCATATTFAVFAARQDISRRTFQYRDFANDDAHLLSFEEFSDLHESEYVQAMETMLQDPNRVYRNMIAHVHELGVAADRKYRFLYYSYSAFLTGTIVTVLSLLALVGLRWSGIFVAG